MRFKERKESGTSLFFEDMQYSQSILFLDDNSACGSVDFNVSQLIT